MIKTGYNIGKNNPNYRGGKIKRICPICKKNFYIVPSRIKYGFGKFCSKKCFSIWRRKETINRKCQICGKDFKVILSWTKKGRGKFCSQICYGKWLSVNIIEEKHPNWKGGITPLIRRIRNSRKYRQWRSDVFEKDDFICQKIGIKYSKLESHHIKSLFLILKKYKITTLQQAIDCKELWNINNGITLSVKAHKEFHRKYGKENNTKKQLDEFLNSNE